MSKIYIPQHLKKIPIISNFYNLLSAYEAENPMRTVDTYVIGNISEVIEQKKEDPVYYFIWNIVENNYKNFSANYRNNLVTYLTKLFYSVKGTCKVFDFMESRLFLSFSSYPTFENGNLKFQLKNVIDFNESASTNFSQAIKNFLERLLYFRKSENTYGTVTITVAETFQYKISSNVIPYKTFTILLEKPDIENPTTPEEPEEPELTFYSFGLFALINGKARIIIDHGPWDLFDGLYIADNYEGNEKVEIDRTIKDKVYEFPNSTSETLYLFVGKRGQNAADFWNELWSTERQSYSAIRPSFGTTDGCTVTLNNYINYSTNQYSTIIPEGTRELYYRLSSDIIDEDVSWKNYLEILSPSGHSYGRYSGDWKREYIGWRNVTESTKVSLNVGIDNIPVDHSSEALDWVEYYMRDKEFEYEVTREFYPAGSENEVVIHNFKLKYKNT